MEITIPSSIDNFDYIEFKFRCATDIATMGSCIVPIDTLRVSNHASSPGVSVMGRSSSGNPWIRRINGISDTVIGFTSPTQVGTSSTNNKWAIVTEIIGLK